MKSTVSHRPATSKTKRTREEDSESESEPYFPGLPASQPYSKRVKLSIPPSVLAQRLSSLQIKEQTPATTTSTEGVAREAFSDEVIPSCRSPLADSDDLSKSDAILDSDARFNDDLDVTMFVSAEAPLSALQMQSIESLGDYGVEAEVARILAHPEKEWWEVENDTDEMTTKLWLSEHAVDFAEGQHWEQWLKESCNDVVAEVRDMLGAGFDDESSVDEQNYQDTREPPPTAKSTCLDCLAETFTHEMYEDRCQDCNLVRRRREICEETERKAERLRRGYKFDESTMRWTRTT